MLELFDRDMKKLAVLENAANVVVEDELNGVGSLTFALPDDDTKAALCKPSFFVRVNGGYYYRILVDGYEIGDVGMATFECEHAIATLVDDVMFRSHVIGGVEYETREALTYILDRQTVRHWRLGECDFSKWFEYGFESENLLNALYAVPNLFVEPYMWTYDMRTYPWTVSLKQLDKGGKPDYYIHAGKNLLRASGSRTQGEVCTRLYLLGYGEGDNQLTIESVNGGKPYLQSPQAYIDQYGLVSKVYVDRQFEDAESLMERGRAILAATQEPRWTREFDVADLYEITHADYDSAQVGGLVRLALDEENVFITKTVRSLDADKPGDLKIEMSTTPMDIAASIADVADRQRIEQVYAQGATVLFAQSVQANADPSHAAEINFQLPKEMRIINKVLLKAQLDSFRSYSRSTRGGGGSATTTQAGGGAVKTSRANSNSETTSEPSSKETVDISGKWSGQPDVTAVSDATSYTGLPDGSAYTDAVVISVDTLATSTGLAGGGNSGATAPSTSSLSTSYSGYASGTGSHRHAISHTHGISSHTHYISSHSHSYTHSHTLTNGRHSHYFNHMHQVAAHRHNMPHRHYIDHSHDISHTHRVKVSAHTHDFDIPAHAHGMTIPEHTHDIVQGIFRTGNPTGADILVNGAKKGTMGRNAEIDITEYLVRDGKIPRDAWLRLGILPNDMAYITIDLIVQGFVQSRGGGTY